MAWGVYLGEQELKVGAMRVLPRDAFLRELATGNVLGTKSGARRSSSPSRRA